MGPGGFALFAGPGCLKRPRAAAFLLLLLVVPRVFRASEAPAAREARQPHCVRRRASKPARALRTLRRPPHQWGWGADVWLCVSSRSLARPRRRPRAPQPSLPVPPAPSAPVVPGRCCLVRRVLLQTSSIRAAFCADFPALVTNVVNPTAFLRKIVVFGLRLTTFVTRVLTEGFKMRQFDDVCNASLPSAVSPCPVGDAVAADWGGSGGFAALGAGCRRVAGVSHL